MVVGAFLYLPGNVFKRLLSTFNMQDSSISYRFKIYKGAIKAISENFVFGHGYDSFKDVYPIYANQALTVRHAHNYMIMILFFDQGLIGLMQLMIIIMLWFKGLLEVYKQH